MRPKNDGENMTRLGDDRLTPGNIKRMEPDDVLRDDVVVGLSIRHRGQSRRWSVYYRTRAGTERRPTIGQWPGMGVEAARKTARELLQQVAQGRDPAAEWKEARDTNRDAPTVRDLWVHYQRWLTTHRNPSTCSDYARIVESVLLPSPLAEMRVADVALQHVEAWVGDVKSRRYTRGKAYMTNGKHTPNKKSAPASANKALAVLSGMFKHAELRTGEPDKGLPSWRRRDQRNPCQGVEQHPQGKRDRYASAEELQAIGAVLREMQAVWPLHVALLRTLLYTGARTSELAQATRAEVVGSRLVLSKHKTARHTGTKAVELTEPALAEIARVSPLAANTGTPYLFGPMPTHTPLRVFWDKVREEVKTRWAGLNIDDLQIRDWRRTFASLAFDPDAPEATSDRIIGGLLGHTNAETTRIYTVLFAETKKRAAESTANRAAALLSVGVPFDDNEGH